MPKLINGNLHSFTLQQVELSKWEQLLSLKVYKTVKQYISRCSVLPFIRMHESTENQLTRSDRHIKNVMVFIIIVVLSVMR